VNDVLGILGKKKNLKVPKPVALLQGTVDLLILRILTRQPLHGWGISKRIQELSGKILSVQQGTLYPALQRLEQRGLIHAAWKDTNLGRTTRFYSLTREGRYQLKRETESWTRISSAVGLLLKRG